MALSIKVHDPTVDVVLHHADAVPDAYLPFFDLTIPLPAHCYSGPAGVDPGKLKTHLREHFIEGLYLDVDGACVSPLGPLLDALVADGRPFITDVVSKGVSGPMEYFAWVEQKTYQDRLGVSMMYALQTSWMFFNDAKELQDLAAEAHDEPIWTQDDLIVKWGASLPDELIYASACSLMDYDPSFNSKPMFYGDKPGQLGLSDIQGRHQLMSLYGNGKGKTSVRRMYIELYDRYMSKLHRECNLPYHTKVSAIMRDKYVNGTARLQRAAARAGVLSDSRSRVLPSHA